MATLPVKDDIVDLVKETDFDEKLKKFKKIVKIKERFDK